MQRRIKEQRRMHLSILMREKWAPPALVFEAEHGGLFANGQPFMLRGLNWFGSEGSNGVVFGLKSRSIGDLLDQAAQGAHKTSTRHTYFPPSKVRFVCAGRRPWIQFVENPV